MSISEAVAEIGKMAKFAKAFEGADVVLKELAGYEQNRQELLASISKLKAEQAKLAAAADKAKLDAAGVLDRASDEAASTVASAKAEAAKILSDAKARAKSAEDAAAESVKAAGDRLAKLKSDEKERTQAADAAAKRLADLTAEADSVTARLRKLVA